MFVLIWATLLFSVRGNNVATDCTSKFCFTFTEGEITAEAGLCAVVSCSFTTGSDPTPPHVAVWFRCDPTNQKCFDTDIIFHSKNASKVQAGFLRRVSLLEPDLTQRNCSIIVNDLTMSDSGSYRIKLNVKKGKLLGSDNKANVTIKDLTQKPTLMVPALMEGEQTTLTCTAPGRCSGSAPIITWMWREIGQNASYVARNATAYTTENLTAVTQRHSSTLTFNPSVKHHGTEVTCKVKFIGDVTTEETFTLNVSYVKKPAITGKTTLNEGDVLNLTCSVKSLPPSIITWTKLQSTKKLHKGNDTGNEMANDTKMDRQNRTGSNLLNKTEADAQNDTEIDLQNSTETGLQSGTARSTLVLQNVTAEHSGRYICTAKHPNKTLRENVDITVMYVRDVEISGKRTVEEGDVLNLTCSAESFPPSRITWTKLEFNKILSNVNDTGSGTETGRRNASESDQVNVTESNLQSRAGEATLIVPYVTAEHSGRYICTAKYQNATQRAEADVTVTYTKKPEISGKSVVKRGDTLNLTCSVESFPPSVVTWTKHGGSKHLSNQTKTEVQNGAAKATLVIPNVTAEDSGRYVCTAKHLNNTLMENADVTLMSCPSILNLSVCVLRSELLTCVCISEGVPLPSIRWPLLENHREHPPITTASSYTVNSIIILPMNDGCNTTVECVSSNEIGEVKGNLNIIKNYLGQEDEPKGFFRIVSQMEIIIAFFCGTVLVAAICCLAKICHRKKQKSSGNQAETLELVTSEENRLINDDQGVENHQIHHQGADGGGADCDSTPNDVEYANIEFSLLKRKSPSEAAKKQEGAETEYAEIKTNEIQDSGGEQGQVLDAEEEEEEELMIEEEELMIEEEEEREEEEELMIEEEEEREEEEEKHCMPEEEDGEELPLYSNNVKDNIDED